MDVFYGRVTDNLAHVYVRVPREGAADRRTVTGSIRGPFCELSQTLPATIALRDMGSGPTLLGSAAIPDPCFWSRQLPALYDVHVELRDGPRVVTSLDQSLGIRRLGAAGRNLLWEGKRFVLRGVGCSPPPDDASADAAMVATFREAAAALLLVDPPDALCRAASQAGVVMVVRLSDPSAVESQLARLARWGAVAIVIPPAGLTATASALHNAAPNLLLAQQCHADEPLRVAEWADLIVCRTGDLTRFPAAVASCPLPIVAERGLNEVGPIAEARAACDRLQRDLAPGGDYAGYLVTQP